MITEQVRLRLITHNARLVDARKAKNWTQVEFGMLVGMTVVQVSAIETLRVIPTDEIMEEIATALNMPIEYLFPSSLIEAMEDGLFDNRMAVLDETQVIRLTEARRSGLLPAPLTDYSIDDIERLVDLKSLEEDIIPKLLSSSG